MTMPPHIRERSRQMNSVPGLTREVAERDFPDVMNWLRENISLVDVMRAQGVKLRPVSADCPDVLVGRCPDCNGPMMVKSHG